MFPKLPLLACKVFIGHAVSNNYLYYIKESAENPLLKSRQIKLNNMENLNEAIFGIQQMLQVRFDMNLPLHLIETF